MKRGWFGAAIALIVIGLAIITGTVIASGFDMKKLGGEEYENREIAVPDSFSKIDIRVSISDVEFKRSEDGTCKVVSWESKSYKHTVKTDDGVLKITSMENRKWYEFTMFQFDSPKVTVYLPEESYQSLSIKVSTGDVKIPSGFCFDTIELTGSTGEVECKTGKADVVKITSSTGNIELSGTEAGQIRIQTSTGKVALSGITAKEWLKINTSTGNVSLKDVRSEGNMEVHTSTGDVKLEDCDAPAMQIKTSTGNVSGQLLSPKNFKTETSTGSVKVPKSSSDETCKIKTSTGDIKITVKE